MRPMPDYRNGGPFTRHMNFGHIAATASAAMTGRAFLLRKCPEPLVFLSGLHSPPARERERRDCVQVDRPVAAPDAVAGAEIDRDVTSLAVDQHQHFGRAEPSGRGTLKPGT